MLKISYGCFEPGVCGQNFKPFKTLALTQELQEETTDYKIHLRTSLTDYVSAMNPKIYQFVVIPGSSGCSVIPP